MSQMEFSTNHIEYLKRDYLDATGSISAPEMELAPVAPESLQLLEIDSLPRREQDVSRNENHPYELMRDILAGLFELGSTFLFAIASEPPTVRIYVGVCRHVGEHDENRIHGEVSPNETTSPLKPLLRGSYPGIETTDISDYSRSDVQDFIRDLPRVAMLTGTPSVVDRAKDDREDWSTNIGLSVDRLIRSLYGTKWAYITIAKPVVHSEMQSLYNAVLNESRRVANARQSSQANRSSVDIPIADRYEELLEEFQSKLETGMSQGAWHTISYLLANEGFVLEQVKGVSKAAFGGEFSTPDPIRVLDMNHVDDGIAEFGFPVLQSQDPPGRLRYPFHYPSVTNSAELSELVHLPTQEVQGYFVRPQPDFDVTSHHLDGKETPDGYEDGLDIGEIINDGRPTGRHYKISPDELKRHTMIAGTTGSGKTNTIFHILSQLTTRDVPFLVIEPAKTEYRSLLESEFGDQVRVLTLGDETTSPFRINPFEIRPEVPVQTHIDYLKSVFNASFVLYAPMPYVLEQCIHEVYEDSGWNLVTNENPRGRHPRAHPTMSDLYEKVDTVVNSLGYESKLSRDIKAALKTRIDNLRIGSKGMMLDTHLSLPISTLLERPTILELDHVGDDDEKAFIIGLILISLYEHYQAAGQREDESLNHVTVIEEAHRLLTQTTRGDDLESANMAGKAVETFSNILAEIRAYGEGVIVAEQIPTKLASDARKNTNLKIAHRIVDEDDRSTMAGTMVSDDEQARWLGMSSVGEAAVFSGQDDHPIRVQVPYRKIEPADTSRGLDEAVRERMAAFGDDHAKYFEPYPWAPLEAETLQRYRAQVRPVVKSPAFREVFARYVLSSVVTADALFEAFPSVVRTVRTTIEGDVERGLLDAAVVGGTDQLFETRGRESGTSYRKVEEVKREFCSLVFEHVLTEHVDLTSNQWPEPNSEVEETWESFRGAFVRHFASETCACVGEPWNADDACIYRYDIERLLADRELVEPFTGTVPKEAGETAWSRLAKSSRLAADTVLTEAATREAGERAALCFAAQVAESEPAYDRRAATQLTKGLFRYFTAGDDSTEGGTDG